MDPEEKQTFCYFNARTAALGWLQRQKDSPEGILKEVFVFLGVSSGSTAIQR